MSSQQQLSLNVFEGMEKLLDEATTAGPGATVDYFRAAAYALGAQMAVVGERDKMPDFLNIVVSELSTGVEVGMRTAHGVTCKLGAEIHAVKRY
ncbi:hypothetical protein QF049_001030 [Paenibacillus sp. W4I10]|uniref:hypothetical protein n=1 Tax=Paenibacillus sp. W4I10 TaxID=3042298 RepID=UPI002784EB52|nr:hypothetical protein [Paenibacillus sp. W4I10]MDQ0719769.1 hypothetical protein [Paenibacillus sp. W4I10]